VAQESKGGSSIPPSVWVAVFAALFGGFAARQVPFQDSRPPELAVPVYMHIPPDDQDVEARLWQDPLAAVVVAKASHAPNEESGTARHTLAGLRLAFVSHVGGSAKVQVIAALVSGAPYAEDIEARRRIRYAVLAGLYEGGYAPENSEHVGYVTLKKSSAGEPQDPDLAAYEWFRSPSSANGSVLALWLDQDGLGKAPLRAISDIVDYIAPASGIPTVSTVILGPTDSDGLRAMSQELKALCAASNTPELSRPKELRSMEIYSARATATDKYVLGDEGSKAGANASRGCGKPVPKGTLWENFKLWSNYRVKLYRTVTTDSLLIQRLIDELKYRGIDPNEVALIAERDTLYGQHMRDYFGAVGDHASAAEILNSPLFFTYLRGLDGFTPPPPQDSSSTAKPNALANGQASSAGDTPVASEAATGQRQLDYLRRLAASLAHGALDRAGQRHYIKAIGVLGSDVYDKILVLQALRSALPRATFFTTDLDARLLDSQNLPWTRQLLIASSLGLSLQPSLQGGVPPFRDTYQSATYFSIRLALQRFQAISPIDEMAALEILEWTQAPRILEIGRHNTFDLSKGSDQPEHQAAETNCLTSPCPSITALEPRNFSDYGSPWHGAAIGVLFAGLLALMAWAGLGTAAMKALVGKPSGPADMRGVIRRTLAGAAAIAVVVASAVLWPLLIDFLTNHGTRHPAPILGGGSHWTDGVLEVLGMLGVVALVLRGQRKLDQNTDRIQQDFGFPTKRVELVAARAKSVRSWPAALRLMEAFLFSVVHVSAERGPLESSEKGSEIEDLLGRYLYRGTGPARFWRVAPAAILVTFFVMWLEQMVLGRPLFGALILLVTGSPGSAALSWISLVSLLFMSFLILWVADAMLLSRGFLLDVLSYEPSWPQKAIDQARAELALPVEQASLWLSLQLIAQRTAWVAGFIWYPSLVLVVMTLAAFTVEFGQFDFSNNPVALIASATLIIVVAITLREAAERLRSAALKELDDAHLRALALAPAQAPQTEELRNRVYDLDDGAFAPFSQQPFFAGVVVPLLTYGATVIPASLHLNL
jgi:hypothetical protein